MNRGKKTVFMQHGVFDSADCWIVNRREVAPAMVLADGGYDVWLGNSRGNKYSNTHSNPFIQQSDYWDFSF